MGSNAATCRTMTKPGGLWKTRKSGGYGRPAVHWDTPLVRFIGCCCLLDSGVQNGRHLGDRKSTPIRDGWKFRRTVTKVIGTTSCRLALRLGPYSSSFPCGLETIIFFSQLGAARCRFPGSPRVRPDSTMKCPTESRSSSPERCSRRSVSTICGSHVRPG